jgi:START domain
MFFSGMLTVTTEEPAFHECPASDQFSPHVGIARSAVDSFLHLLMSAEWSVSSSCRSEYHLASSKCGAYLGRCILPPQVSLSTLKTLLCDSAAKLVIDDALEEVEVLDTFNDSSTSTVSLHYMGYKQVAMVSGREFLVATCARDLSPTSFVIASTSVDDPRFTSPRNRRIRGSVKVGGYLARQLPEGIELTMINKVTLGGQLPEFLLIPIQRQRPAEFLKKIKSQLSV